MAKISANGATKLAERRRVFTTTDCRSLTSVAVLCSDGRILRRLIHSNGMSDGYVLAARIRDARQKGPTALLGLVHVHAG